MNQPDEPQKNTCIESVKTLRLSPEQMRLWLGERRNRLDRERLRLLHAADVLKKEIAEHDQLLAELTT